MKYYIIHKSRANTKKLYIYKGAFAIMDFFVNYGQKFNYTKAMSTNTLIAPHLHPHYELYLCFEPIIRRAILNGQEVPLNHSCAILYAPYSVHSNIAENSAVTYTRYSIYFGKEFLFELFK